MYNQNSSSGGGSGGGTSSLSFLIQSQKGSCSNSQNLDASFLSGPSPSPSPFLGNCFFLPPLLLCLDLCAFLYVCTSY